MAAACNAAAERYRATIRSLQEGARDSTDTSSSFTAGGHAHSNPCSCWKQSSVCACLHNVPAYDQVCCHKLIGVSCGVEAHPHCLQLPMCCCCLAAR